MANIFKTKEAMKHVPKESAIDPLHPVPIVRGIYVTGDYRPPYYIDHTISVTDISTDKPAQVATYTETNVETCDDGTIQIIGFDLPHPDVVSLTTTNEETYDDGCIQVLDLWLSDPTIVDFTSVLEETADDGCIQVLDFQISDIDMICYEHTSSKQPPAYTINIREMSTTKADIIIGSLS